VFPDYSFPSNFFSVQGGRLHYIDIGEGPVIVMVHGNPTWSYYYRHLITLLSKTNRVIALDNMGCGLSDKPQNYPYYLARHIDNLEDLIDHLQIKKFSLIVHDWGGAIGFGCGVRRIESLEKIALMNTAAFRSERIPLRISLCRMPVIGQILVRLFNGFAWPAQFMAVNKKMNSEVAAAFIAPYNSWNNRVAIYHFVKDIPLKQDDTSYSTLIDIENSLITIRERAIPILICWGGKDFCFNDSFFDEWKKRFPDVESHYFKDGGHYVLEDKIDEIKPIVEKFFQQ